MEPNYPRYPVDFYRLRIAFELPSPTASESPAAEFTAVLENPFGTAFADEEHPR